MAKNKAFEEALGNVDIMVAADPDKRSKALDDLLSANQDNIEAVRAAIINNKSFWEAFPGLQNQAGVNIYENNDTLLTEGGDPDDPSLAELRQIAAEQRVSLGLMNAADEILVNILAHNPDECRAYIASKKELGNLSQAHGWLNNEAPDPAIQPPLPPRNKTTTLLSDGAINWLKRQSSDLLLARLIQRTDNLDFLTRLQAAGDKASVELVANQLGYPAHLNAQLTHPLSADVQQVLNSRLNKLKQTAGRAAFTDYVNSLSLDELLDQKDLLEDNVQAFQDTLADDIELNDDDLIWAKGVLATSYLQAFLANTEVDVTPALKATNEEELTAQLKAIPGIGDHEYVSHAVKDNLALLKNAMLQSHIVNRINDKRMLQGLSAAVDLKQFTAALGAAGITPADWVKEADLPQMQQLVRSKLFAYDLSVRSQVGAEAHAQLLSVFAKLPIAKQRGLLNDPKHVYHLLNARDTAALEAHLGKGIPGLDAVVEENQKLANFQQIQNAEVAKILVHFQPEIQLDSEQIKAINHELAVVVNARSDFNNPERYKAWVDSIKAHCEPVDSDDFYKAFGLKKGAPAFKTDSSAREAVIKQNTHNQEMMNAYTLLDDKDPNKQLLGVFLTLDKEAKLDPDKITTAFKSAKTYQEFIETVIPDDKSELRTQLSSQLSSDMFYDLKVRLINKNIRSLSPREFNEAVAAANEEVESIHRSRKTTTQSMEHFKFIEGIEPHHLYNPAFRGAARAKAAGMKGHYQSLSDECDLIVDQLRRQQRMLNNLSKVKKTTTHVDATKLDEFHKKLESELKAIESDLQFYEKIQQNLSGEHGLLAAIDDAADNKKAYIFQAEGVTRRFVSREGVKGLAYASSAPRPSSSIGAPGGSGQKQEFLLKEHAVPAGQIEAVDVVKTTYQPGSSTKTYEAVGRYTVDRSPVTPVSVKGDKVTSTPSGRVDIHQFPKQTVPPAAPGSPEDQRLAQAKIEFALTAAAEAIALLDKAPTKDNPLCLSGSSAEEMRYLWTALIVLGEKNPNIKFGPEAIKLDRFGQNNFDPTTEKSKFLGLDFGFKKDSLYQQFNDAAHQPEVSRKVEAVNTMGGDKMGLFSQRSKVDSQAIEAAASLKKSNTAFRDEANKRKEAEGPEIKQNPSLGST